MSRRFLPSLERKAQRAGAVAHATGVTTGGWQTSRYTSNETVEQYVRRAYERLIVPFRCIDACAQNFADREQYVRDGIPEDSRKSDDIQIEYLFNRYANKYESSWMFKYRLASQGLLSPKGVFVEVQKNRRNRPARMHLLDADRVNPVKDPVLFVKHFEVSTPDGGIDEVLPYERSGPGQNGIIWVRPKPHPTDPYRCVTPLMPAGLSTDTEWLARIYNRSVMMNNGRPNIIISVAGALNEDDAEEIKRRFQGPPSIAGRTTVLETDVNGSGITVQDLSASLQELQYLQGLTASKEEHLLAFGTPESVLGNASGRTFDNADAERLNWWMDTMRTFCNALVAAFDPLTIDGQSGNLFITNNFESVDVLQRAKQAREDRDSAQFKAGEITLDELRRRRGLMPLRTAASSVHWLPVGGTVPVGDNDELTKAAQALQIVGQPQMPGEEQMTSWAQNGARAGINAAQRDIGNQAAAQAIRIARKAIEAGSAKAAVEHMSEREQKNDEEHREPVVIELDEKAHPYEAERNSIESEMSGALEQWSLRQRDDTINRLEGKRAREGTRHWVGEGSGTKALDADYITSPGKWADGVSQGMRPLLERVVDRQLRRTLRECNQAGLIKAYTDRGDGNAKATTQMGRYFANGQDEFDNVKAALVNNIANVVRQAAFRQSSDLSGRVREMDRDGSTVADIKSEITRMIGKRSKWQKGLSVFATTALIEGSVASIIDPMGNLVRKTWNDEHDEKTRKSHFAASGQTVDGGQPFIVGGHKMMQPCDLSAPVGETANCRCWVTFQSAGEQ